MIGPEPCPRCRFRGDPDPDCDICHGTGHAVGVAMVNRGRAHGAIPWIVGLPLVLLLVAIFYVEFLR